MIRAVVIVAGLVVLSAFVAWERLVEAIENRPDPLAGGWARE